MKYPLDAHLSKHLTVREVFGSNEVDELSFFLASTLALRLFEPIRKLVNAPLRITNGYRDLAQHNDLYERGYHPSKTTDHSYGGELNRFGVGALDMLPVTGTGKNRTVRKFTENEYDGLLEHFQRDRTIGNVGQLIWYPKRGHIHVSNPRQLLYSAVAVEKIPLAIKRRFFVYPE